MAKSAEDKKAYAKEYYQKYAKKGLTKGRKKGKAKQESLVGVSISGLNQEGKIEAQLIKDEYKKQMNAALAKAKTDEERIKIKKEYSLKAAQEIDNLKNDPQFAKPSSKKSKSSSKKKSKSLSKNNKKALSKTIEDISTNIDSLSPTQQAQVKNLLTNILAMIR